MLIDYKIFMPPPYYLKYYLGDKYELIESLLPIVPFSNNFSHNY